MGKATVIVYSKPNCMQCQFTKKYLENKGIPFEVKDIEQNEKAIDEVRQLGFSSLPVVIAEGIEAFNGFRPDMLNRLSN
ncbi:MAG: glutaredoxin-like protein NrdH [Alkalibacterium sp.]|uniref:glutaredoxin-like protein NrdH n=1 Tax=Alkalibacterium sp. TaxID=1872447 RepID=UPI0039708DF7